MFPRFLLQFRRPVIIGLHVVLIPVGLLLAFVLRFDAPLPAVRWEIFTETVLYLLAIRLVTFAAFGLFRGWWRHASMQDLLDLVKATTLSSAVFLALLYLTGQLAGFPRSILILDWLVALFLFGGTRFLVRGVREQISGWNGVDRRSPPALMIGAGDAAERLLRQVRFGGVGFRPVGLVDDDPLKRGMRLHGIPVVGTTEDLLRLIARHGVKLLVIAIPSASREEMKRLVERCAETKIEFKIVPSMQELIDGRARLSELRSVQVEDLLGRDTVELNLSLVHADIAGKSVLITGGAGSIGSELARQIAGFSPARLVLVEQAESPLYFTHLEIIQSHPALDVVPVVADIADAARLEVIFDQYRPDYVFHAAAYKHVPLMERNVPEAVRNNVLGTLTVATCAVRCGTQKFVLISTDKAVHPSSVMGATKRIAERIVLGWPSLRASSTDFRAVRFGNVLGSDGSVVPLFRRQLARGGPLTVTHPDVTRYFMTIPEAVQLVLQAAALPEAARRISMLDMGEPVRIVELAENLLRLSGLEPYRDIQIVFSGLRPGEKLHEELMSDLEETVPTTVEKIRVVQTDETDSDILTSGLDRLAAAVGINDNDDLLIALCDLVPECVSPLRDLGAKAMK